MAQAVTAAIMNSGGSVMRIRISHPIVAVVLMAATLVVPLAATTPAIASTWNSHLPNLTGNCGSGSGCGIEVDITPNVGYLTVPSYMVIGGGSFKNYVGWLTCDPNDVGGVCLGLGSATNATIQSLLGQSFPGNQTSLTGDGDGNVVSYSSIQVGDGSEADLLGYEMAKGNWQGAQSTYGTVHSLMSSLASWVSSNGLSCSVIDTKSNPSESGVNPNLFAACWDYMANYAFAELYIASQDSKVDCQNDYKVAYASAKDCEISLMFTITTALSSFDLALMDPTPNAPGASDWHNLSALWWDYDCGYSPVNWYHQSVITSQFAGLFSSFTSQGLSGFDPTASPSDWASQINSILGIPSGGWPLPLNSLPTPSSAVCNL